MGQTIQVRGYVNRDSGTGSPNFRFFVDGKDDDEITLTAAHAVTIDSICVQVDPDAYGYIWASDVGSTAAPNRLLVFGGGSTVHTPAHPITVHHAAAGGTVAVRIFALPTGPVSCTFSGRITIP